jgi:hypothetical protein
VVSFSASLAYANKFWNCAVGSTLTLILAKILVCKSVEGCNCQEITGKWFYTTAGTCLFMCSRVTVNSIHTMWHIT